MSEGPTQLPIQWVTGALSLGVNRPWREADHSPPSNAEVKEWVELHLHSPNTPSWCWAQLKHRDNFTFYPPLCITNTDKDCVICYKKDPFSCQGRRPMITIPQVF